MGRMASLRGQRRPASGSEVAVPDYDEVRANIEKRLFVGRMPVETTEEELMDVFSQYGPVTEIRVLPGKGVAFVGLETWAAAHRAMLDLNGLKQLAGHVEGQTLHVKFAERSGCERTAVAYSRGLDHTRLFVGGLPEDAVPADLEELCLPYGEVSDISLLPPKGGRRCGFLAYSIWGEALDAIEALDGQPHPSGNGEVLRVVFAQEGMSKRLDAGENEMLIDRDAKRRRLVGLEGESGFSAIPTRISEDFERLRDEYIAALEDGSPRDVCDRLHERLMEARPGHSRRSHAGRSHVDAAPPQPPRVPRGPSPRPMRPSPPPRTGRRPISRMGPTVSTNRAERDASRLFIGGLPSACSEEELAHLVNQLPLRASRSGRELVECRVLPGRGCGYVAFASREAASEALEELHDRQVKGWERPLRARWATPTGGDRNPDYDRDLDRERDRSPVHALPNGRGGGGRVASRPTSDISLRGSGGTVVDGVDYRRLFVGQLQPMEGAHERLYALFESFGPLEECRYLERKGVAFVSFQHERDARDAMKGLNGSTVAGISRNDGLSVKYAQKR